MNFEEDVKKSVEMIKSGKVIFTQLTRSGELAAMLLIRKPFSVFLT